MSSTRHREPDPNHPILDRAWEYEIVSLKLEREPVDGGEPFLDLTLRCGRERRLLRFWSPADLEIEKGGPTMTSGLANLDIRARGLEQIGVMVTDFEAGNGSVRCSNGRGSPGACALNRQLRNERVLKLAPCAACSERRPTRRYS